MSTPTSTSDSQQVIKKNWPPVEIGKERQRFEKDRELAIEDMWRTRIWYLILIVATLILAYGFFSLILDLTNESPEFWGIIYYIVLSLLLASFGFLLGYLVGIRDGKVATLKSLRFIPKSYKPR